MACVEPLSCPIAFGYEIIFAYLRASGYEIGGASVEPLSCPIAFGYEIIFAYLMT